MNAKNIAADTPVKGPDARHRLKTTIRLRAAVGRPPWGPASRWLARRGLRRRSPAFEPPASPEQTCDPSMAASSLFHGLGICLKNRKWPAARDFGSVPCSGGRLACLVAVRKHRPAQRKRHFKTRLNPANPSK